MIGPRTLRIAKALVHRACPFFFMACRPVFSSIDHLDVLYYIISLVDPKSFKFLLTYSGYIFYFRLPRMYQLNGGLNFEVGRRHYILKEGTPAVRVAYRAINFT